MNTADDFDGDGPAWSEHTAGRLTPIIDADTAARLNTAMQQLGTGFTAMGQAVWDSIRPLRDALVTVGLHPEVPPTDPRERALWLRQHRNTGPRTDRPTVAPNQRKKIR